jgi:hypothetical protein
MVEVTVGQQDQFDLTEAGNSPQVKEISGTWINHYCSEGIRTAKQV